MNRELPILMSTPMVQAILEGRKTMTRRVIKPQPLEFYLPDSDRIKALLKVPKHTIKLQDRGNSDFIHILPAPCYQVGDHLWVKETWRLSSHKNGDECPCYKADNMCFCGRPSLAPIEGPLWKSGRFMFKKYARLWLEVTAVKAERLDQISEEDAIAEGTPIHDFFPVNTARLAGLTTVSYFAQLWNSINGKTHPWASKPWVWVYTFKRIDKR